MTVKTLKIFSFPFSLVVVFAAFLILVISYWLKPFDNVLSWDVFGYYLYLPSLFIYQDPFFRDLSWLNDVIALYRNTDPLCQLTPAANGGNVPAYSMGLAIIYAPAFLLANIIALLSHYPADGFSKPYQHVMVIWAQLITLTGLWFLRKLLLVFFKDKITAIVIILIVFGTNYFHNAVYGGNMPHNTLFTLLALMLWAIIQWEQKRKTFHLIIVGLCGGMITLIRPTELVVFLIPLFWSVGNVSQLRCRMAILGRYWRQLLIALLALLLVGLPQLIYWKMASGNFFHNPHPGGVGLFPDAPHLEGVLWSFRKGWLLYTPLMVLALAGFGFLYKENKGLFMPFLLYVLVNIYLISSWSIWWYGGGDFSQRAMVSSYAVLSVPLAYLVSFVLQRRSRWVFASIFLFLVALNIFQTWQFHEGIISGERMTKDAWLSVFGKTRIPQGIEEKLLPDRKALSGPLKLQDHFFNEEIILFENFDKPEPEQADACISDTSFGGKYSYVLNGERSFSPGAVIYVEKWLGKNPRTFVRASVKIFIPDDYDEPPPLLASNLLHGETSLFYIDRAPSPLISNAWNTVSLTFLLPEGTSGRDRLYIQVWHRGQSDVRIDMLQVSLLWPHGPWQDAMAVKE